MVQEYDLVTVAKSDFSETGRTELAEQIKKLIAAEKGEIVDIKDWGKRELAYEIKRNTHGFYTIFTFKGDAKTPQAISTKLNLLEEVLRFLIVRKEGQKTESRKQRVEGD